MKRNTHDPSEYIRGLQQLLVSDKKRIGFLFGAGSSLAQKDDESLTVPAIGKMTNEIVVELSEETAYKTALDEVKDELKEGFNIETVLSNLEQKEKLVGKSKLNELDKGGFKRLIKDVKNKVRDKVSVHKDKEGVEVTRSVVKNLVQTDFAAWVQQAERKYPIEIFTTNYDFLFELGLEYKEIPYYDGFCGSLRPFFNPESVEDLGFLPNQTKLWKIHGSLGWHFNSETEKILRVNPDEDDILIYPSNLKYKDSKKQPYESLMDRLSNFLKKDDAVLITCGYSWGDEHINSRIVSALKTDTTSHVVGLLYDKQRAEEGEELGFSLTEDSPVAKIAKSNPKISMYGGRQAVIGCKHGDWQLKSEPDKEDAISINLYFDEDAYNDLDDEIGKEKEGEQHWTGKGEFMLPDFSKTVRFLNSMVNENEIRKLGTNAK